MLVLTLENAPPKLIGYCSSWAIQISTHVFVANLPAREREVIWKKVLRWAREDTSAVMVWPSPRTEQGIDFEVLGQPRRSLVEREGFIISRWCADPEQFP